MKKLFFLLTIVSFLIVSCEKDADDISKNTTDNNQSTFTFEQVNIDKEQSKENLAKIKAFKDRMESDTKEVEWLTEEEAEWLIEAAANYDYTDISEAYPQYDIDTFMYMVPRTTDGISSEDLETVYDAISEDIEDVLASLEHGEDVEIHGIIIDLNDMEGEQDLRADIFVHLGFYPNVNVFSEANNDTWYWGGLLGNTNGDGIGTDDATTQMTFASNQALQSALNVSNITFTSPEYLTITYGDVPYNNSYGSRIWHKENVSYSPVLDPNEMNTFTNHALYSAQLFKPIGKMIQYMEIQGTTHTWTDHMGTHTNCSHYINVIYGTPNL